jgi:hypothetical protein
MIKVGVVVTVGRVICSTQLILLIGSAINGVLLTLDRLHSRWKNQHAAFGGTAVSPRCEMAKCASRRNPKGQVLP